MYFFLIVAPTTGVSVDQLKSNPLITIRNQNLILFKNTPYFNEMHIFISVNIYYLFTHKEEKNSYALK